MSTTATLLVILFALIATFGFVYLIQKKAESQARSGRPSLLIRISAIMVGVASIGLVRVLPWIAIPASIILLGYGVFGLFGTVQKNQIKRGGGKMEAPGNLSRRPGNKLTLKRMIIGCGIVVLIMLCFSASYLVYLARDPGVLAIRADYPDMIQVGDSFELTLSLTNNGKSEAAVQSIVFTPALEGEDSILAGATLNKTDPAMNGAEYPLLKAQAYFYNRVLKPGESQRVIFTFQAFAAGEFHSCIDVQLSDSTTGLPDIGITITP